MTKIAVVGLGAWGLNYVRLLEDARIDYIAIDPSPVAVTRARSEYIPTSIVQDSIEALLSDSQFDAAIVASPARTHVSVVKMLLENGKHVLVEKPVAFDSDSLDDLYEMADDRGLVLMSGHLLQHHPAVREMVSLIEGGHVGHVRHVSSFRMSPGQVRTDENVLWSLAPHDVALVLEVFGFRPTSLNSWATHILGIAADVASCHLVFGDDVRALIHVNWLSMRKTQQLTVVGSEGVLIFDDQLPWDRKLSIAPVSVGGVPEHLSSSRLPMNVAPTAVPVVRHAALEVQLDAFIRAISGFDSLERDRWLTRSVTAILQAADASCVENGASKSLTFGRT